MKTHTNFCEGRNRRLLLAVFVMFLVAASLPTLGAACPEGVTQGTNYGTWTGSCPGLSNSPSVSPGSLCAEIGQAPTTPTTIVVPVYTNGLFTRTVTYNCHPPDDTNETRTVSYTVSGVLWNPPLPSVVTNSFTSQAYVTLTSSDTNLCSNSSYSIGSAVSWNVGCAFSHYTTNCTEGTLTLTNLTLGTNVVCFGGGVSANVSHAISNAVQVITSHHTNTCGNVDTNCPNTHATNLISPSVLSNWWVATVSSTVGSYSAQGTGLSASFTPTNPGNGTVTFYTKWRGGCSTNITVTSVATNFTVRGVQSSFSDGPRRGSAFWPCTWSATLQAVCQSDTDASSYTSLASITYGFSIAADGTVTTTAPASGGRIVVTSFSAVSEPNVGGVNIAAYYVGGCECTTMLRWVQTITTSAAPPGCTSPYNDPCPGDDNLPYYWTDAQEPGNHTNIP